MNKNLAGIDVIMLHNAQIAFHRLSIGYTKEHVNWDSIKEFQEMFSKVCNNLDDPETKKFVSEVLRESHGDYPYRRRTDAMDQAVNMILDELDLLIKERVPRRNRAQHLYMFCHIFTKHTQKENSPSLVSNLQTISV